MKPFRAFLIASVLLVLTCAEAGAVTGYALLDGRTDHSGTRVRFIARSLSAVNDSAITDASGRYEAPIAGGIYEVMFSHQGFRDTYYQNGNEVALASSDVLDSVSLKAGTAKIVTGDVSGMWYADTVYLVMSNLRIPALQALEIEPGTRVEFMGDYEITVNGLMRAAGTADRNVLFTSGLSNPKRGDWHIIRILANGSTFEHCTFELCSAGIRSEDHAIQVIDCTFREFLHGAIYNRRGSSLIRNNHFFNYGQGDVSWAIWVEGSATATIECNRIQDGEDYGIITKSNNIVRNNHIWNLQSTSGRGRGIWVDNPCSPRIYNNYVHNCLIGIELDGANETSNRQVYDNTVIMNWPIGIEIESRFGSTSLRNNIVFGNGVGIIQRDVTQATDTIAHNLVWNNTDGNFANIQITGIGKPLTTNVNGDTVDAYFNLQTDPEFTGYPYLSPTSPVVGAGDPTVSKNIGYDPNFVCGAPTSVEAFASAPTTHVDIVPNPATHGATAWIDMPSDASVLVTVVAVHGGGSTVVFDGVLPHGRQAVSLHAAEFVSGMYYVVVAFHHTRHVMLMSIVR